jgi:bacterioferritin
MQFRVISAASGHPVAYKKEGISMANNEKVIAGLQTIVTDLAQQADGHQLQSRIFANMGFTKLADKYAEHAEEERGWVTKCIDRLLDLGCEVKLGAKEDKPVCKNPVDWLKYDLQVSIDGLAWLRTLPRLPARITPPSIS